MFRKLLNTLYTLSGGLSAVFLVAIGLSIIAQMLGRSLGMIIDATEFSGFCLSASAFLGLAYTLRHGGHVRVSVLLEILSPARQRVFEIISCTASAIFAAYASWWMVLFTYESYEYGDLSPGIIAAPMWIPQLGMCIGLLILTIALVDDLMALLRHQKASYQSHAHETME